MGRLSSLSTLKVSVVALGIVTVGVLSLVATRTQALVASLDQDHARPQQVAAPVIQGPKVIYASRDQAQAWAASPKLAPSNVGMLNSLPDIHSPDAAVRTYLASQPGRSDNIAGHSYYWYVQQQSVLDEALIGEGFSTVVSPRGHIYMIPIKNASSQDEAVAFVGSKLRRAFNSALPVTSKWTDPRANSTNIVFTAMSKGVAQTGMFTFVMEQDGQGHGYLMFDDTGTVDQSAPVMMKIVAQTESAFSGNTDPDDPYFQ